MENLHVHFADVSNLARREVRRCHLTRISGHKHPCNFKSVNGATIVAIDEPGASSLYDLEKSQAKYVF